MNDPLKMEIQMIETADGSCTFWSDIFNEAAHNTTGAISETKHIYIEGCDLINKAASKASLSILDVGLGMGHNLEQTVLALKDQDMSCDIYYTAIEIDPRMVELTLSRFNPHALYQHLTLNILTGDGLQTLKQYHGPKFNLIYQDAFSPKNNPTLWSVEWFSLLKEHSSEDVILSTYSSSTKARKSLFKAGFIPAVQLGFGDKRESTIATLSGELSTSLQEKFARSSASEIYLATLQSK